MVIPSSSHGLGAWNNDYTKIEESKSVPPPFIGSQLCKLNFRVRI
jgi:hypothetical protein